MKKLEREARSKQKERVRTKGDAKGPKKKPVKRPQPGPPKAKHADPALEGLTPSQKKKVLSFA